MSSRDAILGRVRSALGRKVSPADTASIDAHLAIELATISTDATGGVCWPSLRRLDWIGAGLGMEDRPARGDDLVGVTGCFCAIAETGTLMLASGADTPAAASLLPETHIAIVETARIVPFMEDAWALLRAERGQPPRSVNFVSGPSRTADIEQTVTMGAHGPYRVHIILVGA